MSFPSRRFPENGLWTLCLSVSFYQHAPRDMLTTTVQYLPDWMPGTGFKKTAREMAAQLDQTTEQPYAFVKQQMREKKHKTSFLSQAIENIGSDAAMERIHKWSASSMYLGGADTTVSALMTFFLAMTLFPDVQKKAQAELDSIMGDSLPLSADRERLPYIWAVVQETHRWHPVAPMAIPHASTKDSQRCARFAQQLVVYARSSSVS
jgi:cytochrome P450